MKFRKKPIVIEAIQFKNDDPETLVAINELLDPMRVSYRNPKHPVIIIDTLEGEMTAQIGDWIIKGVNGECYPCKPDIFEKTYEPVN